MKDIRILESDIGRLRVALAKARAKLDKGSVADIRRANTEYVEIYEKLRNACKEYGNREEASEQMLNSFWDTLSSSHEEYLKRK